ncbi:NlpC/P60 family protein [Sphingopyxis solisilvae]|uniref:peptidoglycan endopeptidase n=1 Tax=Sphingopyxis solisilvae TaxID=1886788 RepID=UPI002B4B28D6|nr:peptidoglycan endopeptidase [Sphingopyxis solisilvae]
MAELRGQDLGARAFVRARRLVGARFRPQGYDPATGLDCVGLVWAAYAAAGRRLVRPRDYPLRGWSRERIAEALGRAGFGAVDGPRQSGDVALIALAAGQFHLGLMGQTTFVHAHAGLRRVVETPVDQALSDAALWRFAPD